MELDRLFNQARADTQPLVAFAWSYGLTDILDQESLPASYGDEGELLERLYAKSIIQTSRFESRTE